MLGIYECLQKWYVVILVFMVFNIIKFFEFSDTYSVRKKLEMICDNVGVHVGDLRCLQCSKKMTNAMWSYCNIGVYGVIVKFV